MRAHRAPLALVAVLAAAPGGARAQETAAGIDTAGIHTTLRAFYFNLAHQDWEAIATDVLSAKVVAHRPAPEALLTAAASAHRAAGTACSSGATAFVGRAVILHDGDWVEAFVPRCTTAATGADEFRLIRFEERWRLVHIDLFDQPVNVVVER
jgi:hypothetical protein